MWRKIFQILVIATATLMSLNLAYTLFTELGWQGGLLGSLLFAAFAAPALAVPLYGFPHFDLGKILDNEEKCLSLNS